jgi:Serine dehydrogenase proteinase
MEKFNEAVQKLKSAQADRDFLIVSSPISRDLHYRLSGLLATKSQHKKCTVFLTTFGGDPDGGYRIARCLRHHYPEHLRVAVSSWCKSAGTLVAIAANELGIGDFGELGPLDIQVHKGSELQERSSGLDIIQALAAVTSHAKMTFHEMLRETRGMGLSTKLSAEFAAHVSSAVAAPLFAQIDPMRIGEMQRATRIAFEYGQRLDKYAENLKPDALELLINAYPSHSFVIDRKEAKELFKNVGPLTQEEQGFVDLVWPAIRYQSDLADIVFAEEAEDQPDLGDSDEQPIDSNEKESPISEAGETSRPEPDRSGSESRPTDPSLRLRSKGQSSSLVHML